MPGRQPSQQEAGSGERSKTFSERAPDKVEQTVRQHQHTDLFKALYRGRASVAGTIARGTHTSDLHRSRYIGLVKTRLLHLLIITVLNFMRLAVWLVDIPHAQTWRSAFAKLAPVPT